MLHTNSCKILIVSLIFNCLRILKCSWIICQLICKFLQHYKKRLNSYVIYISKNGSNFACNMEGLSQTQSRMSRWLRFAFLFYIHAKLFTDCFIRVTCVCVHDNYRELIVGCVYNSSSAYCVKCILLFCALNSYYCCTFDYIIYCKVRI